MCTTPIESEILAEFLPENEPKLDIPETINEYLGYSLPGGNRLLFCAASFYVFNFHIFQW